MRGLSSRGVEGERVAFFLDFAIVEFSSRGRILPNRTANTLRSQPISSSSPPVRRAFRRPQDFRFSQDIVNWPHLPRQETTDASSLSGGGSNAQSKPMDGGVVGEASNRKERRGKGDSTAGGGMASGYTKPTGSPRQFPGAPTRPASCPAPRPMDCGDRKFAPKDRAKFRTIPHRF